MKNFNVQFTGLKKMRRFNDILQQVVLKTDNLDNPFKTEVNT